MHKKLLFLFAVMAISVSCGNKPNLLPKPVFIDALLDINIAETYCSIIKDTANKGTTKNIDSLAVYYKSIFAHHHITSEQFTETLQYYEAHPEDLDTLYEKVLTKALTLNGKLN